jgi:hypothetical protein
VLYLSATCNEVDYLIENKRITALQIPVADALQM